MHPIKINIIFLIQSLTLEVFFFYYYYVFVYNMYIENLEYVCKKKCFPLLFLSSNVNIFLNHSILFEGLSKPTGRRTRTKHVLSLIDARVRVCVNTRKFVPQ